MLELRQRRPLRRRWQFIDEVGHDPRRSEFLRDCSGLKEQPRRLKVVLSLGREFHTQTALILFPGAVPKPRRG